MNEDRRKKREKPAAGFTRSDIEPRRVNRAPKTPSLTKSKKILRNELALCGLIFILSFCVRLVYLLDYQKSPFFDEPVVDAQFHQEWALDITQGDIFSLKQGDVLYKPPFYPYFMALIFSICRGSIFALHFVQIILGSCNVVLIYLIAAKYFPRKASVPAALIYSLYFAAIFFDAEIEIPTLAIFLTLFCFYLLKAAKKWAAWAFSAVLLGFSILTLPTNLLLVPLYLWILFRKLGRTPSIIYGALVVVVVLPATLRNMIYGKHFVLISANGGINFFIGNNNQYDQTTSIQPGIVWEHFVSQPNEYFGRIPTNFEQDRYWYKKSFQNIRENLISYLGLLAKKTTLYFMNYEIMRNRDIYFARNQSIFRKIPLVSLFIIFPAGILGLIFSLRQASGKTDLYFLLGLLILPCILFFVTSRYRLPSIGAWSIFAGYFFTRLVDFFKEKKWSKLTCSLAALVFLALVSRLNFWVVKNPESRPYYNQGNIYSRIKDFPQARENYHRCLDLIDPQNVFDRMIKAEVAVRLSTTYFALDDPNTSMKYLDEAAGWFADYDRIYFNKAIIYLDNNQNQLAYDNFLKFLSYKNPRNEDFNYIITAINRIMPSADAIKTLIESYQNTSWQALLYNYLGARQIQTGDLNQAGIFFETADKLNPDDSATLANLAYIARQNQDEAQAVQLYQEAEEAEGKKFDYYFLQGIDEAKTGIAQNDPARLRSAQQYLLQAARFRDSAGVYYNLGLICFTQGKNEEAVPYLKKALQIDKEKEQARTLLEHILDKKQIKPPRLPE